MGYWRIAPGENAFLWVEQRDNNCIAVGWDIGDLRKYSDQEIKKALKREFKYKRPELSGLWKFYKKVRKDDKIIASAGRYLYGVGTVTKSRYSYNQKLYYPHSKSVRWETTFWEPLDIWDLRISKKLKKRLMPQRGRTIIGLKREEFDKVQKVVDKVKTPFKNLTNWEGLLRAPWTEQEVVIVFSKLSNIMKMKIEYVGTRFPDATILVKKGAKWVTKTAEFEIYSSGFQEHLKDLKKGKLCDFIICWEADWKPRSKKIKVIELVEVLREIL